MVSSAVEIGLVVVVWNTCGSPQLVKCAGASTDNVDRSLVGLYRAVRSDQGALVAVDLIQLWTVVVDSYCCCDWHR